MLKKLSYLLFILVLNFNLSIYSSDASKSPDDDLDVILKAIAASDKSTSDSSASAAAPAVHTSSFQLALSPATLQLPGNVTKTLIVPFVTLLNGLIKTNKKDLQAGYNIAKADCSQASKKAAVLMLSFLCAYYGLRNFADGNYKAGLSMTILGLAGIFRGGSLVDHFSPAKF